jgi:glutathione S-transferase
MPVTSKYVLYGRQQSGSLAVQVALEELGLPYERIWIGRDSADLDRLRRLNPSAKVPALVLPDGTVMYESAAMLLHLTLAHPQGGLAPSPGSGAHAVFLQWLLFLAANLYEAALRIYYPARYSSSGEAGAEAVKAQALHAYLQHLEQIAPALRPYVLGAGYSVADVYLYMLGTWYTGERAELYRRIPALGAHAALLGQRAAVLKVEADHAQ